VAHQQLKKNKKKCMHFVEEHCFGCASTLTDEYGYIAAQKKKIHKKNKFQLSATTTIMK